MAGSEAPDRLPAPDPPVRAIEHVHRLAPELVWRGQTAVVDGRHATGLPPA